MCRFPRILPPEVTSLLYLCQAERREGAVDLGLLRGFRMASFLKIFPSRSRGLIKHLQKPKGSPGWKWDEVMFDAGELHLFYCCVWPC